MKSASYKFHEIYPVPQEASGGCAAPKQGSEPIKEAVETRKRAPKMGVRRREPWGDGDEKFQGKTREEPLLGEQDGEDPTRCPQKKATLLSMRRVGAHSRCH